MFDDLHAFESLAAASHALAADAAAGGSTRAKPTASKISASNEAVVLLNRIAPGASRAERSRVATMGYEAYLEEQLNPAALDDSALDSVISQNLIT